MGLVGAAPALLVLADETDSVEIRPVPATAASPVVVTEFDPGAPDIRDAAQPRAGLDGTLDGTAYTGSRVVTLDLVVFGSLAQSAYELAERLAGFTHPHRRPYLYASRAGQYDDEEWRIALRGNPFSISYGRRAAALLELTLAFTAPDGYFESPLREAARLASLSEAPSALEFPTTFPIQFHTTGITETAEVTVAGSAPVAPVVIVTGPATDPVLTTTAGHRFEFTGLTLDAGRYVEIDMAAGTVRLDGEPTSSVYHLVNWQTSSPWRLRPGGHSVRTSSGQLRVRWRDRRLTI